MPLWINDVGTEIENDETEQRRVIPCLGNSGSKNTYSEYELGGYEQLKRDSVDILKDFSDRSLWSRKKQPTPVFPPGSVSK